MRLLAGPAGEGRSADVGACLLVAVNGAEVDGYLLGFRHLTFFANGPVGWVEEIVVRGRSRRQGTGRALMSAFEHWAALQGCALVALATRRTAPFYRSLGYVDSATYFRKVLVNQATVLSDQARQADLEESRLR